MFFPSREMMGLHQSLFKHNINTLDLSDPGQEFVNKRWEDTIEIILLSIVDRIALSCLLLIVLC
jgi:hypothetical protein